MILSEEKEKEAVVEKLVTLGASKQTLSPESLLKQATKLLRSQKPLTSEDYKKHQEEDTLAIDAEGGILIQPTVFACIKTAERLNGGAVFINLVGHAAIGTPAPTEAAEEAGRECMSGLRFPLSIGEIFHEADAKGRPYRCVDVVLSEEAIEELNDLQNLDSDARSLLSGLAELAMGEVQRKHQVQLHFRWKLLRNCRYKGPSIRYQRVRVQKKPRIERIRTMRAVPSESHIAPEWRLYACLQGKVLPFDGFNLASADGLQLQLQLPLLATCTAVVLYLTPLAMCLDNRIYKLLLALPRRIDRRKSSAKFDVKERFLVVTCPFSSSAESKQVEQRTFHKIDFCSEKLFDVV